MTSISDRLLTWYRTNGRSMPWRGQPDPYAVWVSEIMLQQTQVATVTPYFERWMRRFPTVRELADASEQEVLSTWEGLGYYSRARNLHKAARILMEGYGGVLPRDLRTLRALPGIGRYTAAAIASLAFGQDTAAVDGNVGRVFARLFNISEPVDSPATQRRFWDLAQEHLPLGRAGDYNQALMDLGATVCLPRRPLCTLCPLEGSCEARLLGLEEARPVRKPRPTIPTRIRAAAVIRREGRVLVSRRPSVGLLGGLWEFPSAPVDADPALELGPGLEAAYQLRVQPGPFLGMVRHAYTHFRVIEHVFACEAEFVPAELTWVPLTALTSYPMGKVDRKISAWLDAKTARA
jgi:A/G-specific adenine glycosylase